MQFLSKRWHIRWTVWSKKRIHRGLFTHYVDRQQSPAIRITRRWGHFKSRDMRKKERNVPILTYTRSGTHVWICSVMFKRQRWESHVGSLISSILTSGNDLYHILSLLIFSWDFNRHIAWIVSHVYRKTVLATQEIEREFQYRIDPSEGMNSAIATAFNFMAQELWKKYWFKIIRRMSPDVSTWFYHNQRNPGWKDEKWGHHSFTDIRDSRLFWDKEPEKIVGTWTNTLDCNGTDSRDGLCRQFIGDGSWCFGGTYFS